MILFLISLFSCYWEWTLLRKYTPFTSKLIYNYTHPYISWPKFFSSVFWMLSEWSVISFLLFLFFCVSSYHLFTIIVFLPLPSLNVHYSKSSTNKSSSCKLSKMQMCVCVCISNYVRSKWNCSLPSVSYCWWSFSSAISHLFSLPQLVSLLACSLNISPCMPAIVMF